MPKKKKPIFDRLPEGAQVIKAIGPKEVRPIGNGGYCLTPPQWVGAQNIWVVKVAYPKKEEKKCTCEICSNELPTVFCEKYGVRICGNCCRKCSGYAKCPYWNGDLYG